MMLADAAAQSGEMIPVTAVTAVIGAIASGIALVIGKRWGRIQRTRIEEPVPEVPVRMRKASLPPTWEQHTALEHRMTKVERDVEALRTEQGKQFKELLLSGQERELRLSEKLDDIARAIHSRIDDLFKARKS